MAQDYQNEIQNKIVKGLLDMIVLELLNKQPMHGYQIIIEIRKVFGIYYGPSTVYPLLETLEKKGVVKSAWTTNFERPRKIYKLTSYGENILDFAEDSLTLIRRTMASDDRLKIEVASFTPTRAKFQYTSTQLNNP